MPWLAATSLYSIIRTQTLVALNAIRCPCIDDLRTRARVVVLHLDVLSR